MQNPVGYVVIADHVENLGFINVPGIGPGMEDAVGINGKGLPVAGLSICLASYPIFAQCCKVGKEISLLCIKLLFNIQQLGIIIFIRTHIISLKQCENSILKPLHILLAGLQCKQKIDLTWNELLWYGLLGLKK